MSKRNQSVAFTTKIAQLIDQAPENIFSQIARDETNISILLRKWKEAELKVKKDEIDLRNAVMGRMVQ